MILSPPIHPPEFHLIVGAFLFALGACVGSFLNVVIWRLPRGESLSRPPSHCSNCNALLHWYDNIPIFGWLFLRGRCRYCREPISARYPIVELATALMFVFFYWMFFIRQIGPGIHDPSWPAAAWDRIPLDILRDWPIFLADLFLLSSLLAASLIDAELYVIPLGICWLAAAVGIVIHTAFDQTLRPGSLPATPATAALALGGGIGLILSILMLRRDWLKTSFPKGEPLLDIDRAAIAAELAASPDQPILDEELPPDMTRAEVRREMRKEIIFLFLPFTVAIAFWLVASLKTVAPHWSAFIDHPAAAGFCGSLFGALIGGLVVWFVRIVGTIAFGRVAMGMGDVHLMFAVGAVLGPGAAVVAFFLAPFFGLLVALWRLITRSSRELPFGPYLSLATALVLLIYTPIARYMAPGLEGLMEIIHAHV